MVRAIQESLEERLNKRGVVSLSNDFRSEYKEG